MTRRIRTRFAPSPTGFLHIGGVRTALYCYLFARKHGGDFILRIEDTDQNRYVSGAEDYIIEALNWCGIQCDEGTHVGGNYGSYRQSERKSLYKQYIQQLLESGHGYYAFDTTEELTVAREKANVNGKQNFKYNAATRLSMKNSLTLSAEEVQKRLENGEPYVIRVKIPADEEIRFNDLVRGVVRVNTNEMDDKVMMKSDGMPTYHFANIVDDHTMEISHVIRGEEWLPSTPLHVILYRFMGWENTMPQFAHLPLIMKPVGKGKLSKRDGDKLGFPVFPLAWQHPKTNENSNGYREMGFFPEAFINMLVFFGWNPGTEQEIFSLDELIQAFSVARISKSGARFDFDKAKWFNQQYIMKKSDTELARAVWPFTPAEYQDRVQNNPNFLAAAVGMMKPRMSFLSDFWENAAYLFDLPKSYDSKVIRKKWKADRIPAFTNLRNQLAELDNFSSANVEKTIKAFVEQSGLGFGNVLQPFRVMLTGVAGGPSIFDTAALLGQAETLRRIEVGMAAFNTAKGF